MNTKWLNIIFIFLLTAVVSCSTDPEQINYGTDQCALCRMNISEQGFGAEIVTKKGKIYKYDGTECMMNALALGNIPIEEASGLFVIDAANPNQLTNAVKRIISYQLKNCHRLWERISRHTVKKPMRRQIRKNTAVSLRHGMSFW